MKLGNVLRLVLFFETILTCVGSCRDISKCTANIANEVFDAHRVTAVVWWRVEADEVTRVLRQLRGSVATAPILQATRQQICQTYTTLRYRQLLFIATDAEEFHYYLSVIHPRVVIPFRAILLLSTPVPDSSELTRAMKAAWDYDVSDIIVLSTDIGVNPVKISTYFPYGSDMCGDVTPIILDITHENFFPRKFDNFNRCPIKVSVTTFPGAVIFNENNTSFPFSDKEGNVLSLLLETLNASLEIVTLDRDYNPTDVFPNGTAIGTFKDVVDRKADILLPTRVGKPYGYEVTQACPVLQFTYMYWIAPSRREMYTWAKVFLPFFSNISIPIFLSFISFFIVIKLIKKYSLRHPEIRRGIIFRSFAIFLGQGIKFTTSCWLVNSLFVLWIWFCLIISAAYQGELVARLQEIILEPPLRTLGDALKAVDGWGGLASFREFYKNRPDVWNKYQVLDQLDTLTYLNEICRNGKRFLIIVSDGYPDRAHCDSNFQVIDDSVFLILGYIHMRPAWPAAGAVQEVLFQVIESGIYSKIKKDNKYPKELKTVTPLDFNKIDPLIITFYGLLIMHLICFIIFCGEIVYHKYKTRKGKIIYERTN